MDERTSITHCPGPALNRRDCKVLGSCVPLGTTAFVRSSLLCCVVLGNVLLWRKHVGLIQTSPIQAVETFQLHHPTKSSSSTFTMNPLGNHAREFGACLMFKDDLEWLSEWLAYHYVVLPLRYVVLGIDGGNTQDPLPILRKWEQVGIKYEILSVMEDYQKRPDLSNKHYNLSHPEGAHHGLVSRQRAFVQACTIHMRDKGVQWTAYTDTDEFITFHADHGQNYDTVVAALQAYQEQGSLQTPCYTMPRLRFGALETTNCTTLSMTLTGEASLMTRRFVQHAKPTDFTHSRFGKVLMNVSALDFDIRRVTPRIIHRPYKPVCGPAGLVIDQSTRIRVNHYTGDLASFLGRPNDARRTPQAWQEFANLNYNASCHDPTMGSWVRRFVRAVGVRRAYDLLNLEPS